MSVICSSLKPMAFYLYFQMSKLCYTDREKLQHLQYLINALLPFVKDICEDQDNEITLESVSRGIIYKLWCWILINMYGHQILFHLCRCPSLFS